MREIKFRAWDKETKELSYDFLSKNWLKVCVVSPYVELMQYTGLTDRNGKEVYEGDIVKGAHRANEEWVQSQEVKYSKGCFMFGNWNAHEYFNKHTNIEIIGNVYENPELVSA